MMSAMDFFREVGRKEGVLKEEWYQDGTFSSWDYMGESGVFTVS